MEERDNLREQEQTEGTGKELNVDLPGESPMSYPLDHKDLIQKNAFLFGFKLYFCLESKAKANLEKLPSK